MHLKNQNTQKQNIWEVKIKFHLALKTLWQPYDNPGFTHKIKPDWSDYKLRQNTRMKWQGRQW